MVIGNWLPKQATSSTQIPKKQKIYTGTAQKNNPTCFRQTGLKIKAGNDLLSRCGSIIGAADLTAEFGMVSGVAPLLWSPAKDHASACSTKSKLYSKKASQSVYSKLPLGAAAKQRALFV